MLEKLKVTRRALSFSHKHRKLEYFYSRKPKTALVS